MFSHASRLPVSLAWEAFGEKNGARDFAQMRDRVSRYRGEPATGNADYVIGCRILVQPVFLPEIAWIPLPASWPRNVQVGKVYGTDHAEGRALWDRIVEAGAAMPTRSLFEPASDTPPARYGEPPMLVKPRLGQGAFRIAVTDAYGRQCAVSGGRVLPALEAAHIHAFGAGGGHEVSNGLLLRRDIHSVFDAGYVTIGRDLRFIVSDRVKTDFNNGNEYRRLHGARLTTPAEPRFAPSVDAIDWHNRERFLG